MYLDAIHTVLGHWNSRDVHTRPRDCNKHDRNELQKLSIPGKYTDCANSVEVTGSRFRRERQFVNPWPAMAVQVACNHNVRYAEQTL